MAFRHLHHRNIYNKKPVRVQNTQNHSDHQEDIFMELNHSRDLSNVFMYKMLKYIYCMTSSRI